MIIRLYVNSHISIKYKVPLVLSINIQVIILTGRLFCRRSETKKNQLSQIYFVIVM